MLESKLQFYAPETFWNTFKLWGQPVNVREQQDAYDFFCNLTDQVDEQLKVCMTHIIHGLSQLLPHFNMGLLFTFPV